MARPRTMFDMRFDPPIKGLQFSVDRFAHEIDDFRELFHEWSQMFQSAMGRQFRSEGAWGGEAWTDLTEPYKLQKEDMVGFVYPIGVLTGAMRAAMTGHLGYHEQISARRAEFGMADSSKAAKYAPYFDKLRPIIRMPHSEGRKWQKRAHEWLHVRSGRAFSGALAKGLKPSSTLSGAIGRTIGDL